MILLDTPTGDYKIWYQLKIDMFTALLHRGGEI